MSVVAELNPTSYQLVDAIPEVAAARVEVRSDAMALLDERRINSNSSEISELVPVDALSTAHGVLVTEHNFGNGSNEHQERWNGLKLDCQRLVGEWYRKKKPEYFEPLHHKYDPETQSFYSHGLSIRQMIENALVPMPDNAEEEARRVNERVEDETPLLVQKLGNVAVGGVVIRTISECTDKALNDYAEDIKTGNSHRGYGGYVPEIAKLMVRDIRIDSVSGDRLEEQIGLPGTHITHEIIQEALNRCGANVEDMDKTRLHGSQILAKDDMMDFAMLLDEVASEEWCVNLFLGEVVPEDFVKDYAGFREEARRRQASLSGTAETVATFVLDLARDKVDRREALVLVEEFVKKLLLDVGKQDLAVAEQMFDKQTAIGLRQVAALEAAGRQEEAFALQQQVEKNAPGGGYCGAGSCGLESVSTGSKEGRELAKKLHAESGDTIVRDKVRACKCGSRKIVYAYSKSKVNKFCEHCGAFESKMGKSSAKSDYVQAA